jgi:hypothetical protein
MPSVLPPLYATWLAQVLAGPIPPETKATCQQCAMCPPNQSSPASAAPAVFFHPQAKCCTYLPRLANFLVGRILADEAPEGQEGQATIVQRIQGKIAVTPLGLQQDSLYRLLAQAT